MDTIIVDLDNCISDDEWRMNLIDEENKYDSYHAACIDDKPDNLNILKGTKYIVIFTSRPEAYRQQTKNWLIKYNIKYDLLIMRPTGNHMKSVDLKRFLLHKIFEQGTKEISCAYDDRMDVVEMYKSEGICAECVFINERELPCSDPEFVMVDMLKTFKERNKIYGDNWKRIGCVLEALFPDGVTIKTAKEHNRYHLFMMIMVKITRLSTTNINHIDSAHDIAVYSAMLESLLKGE